MKAVKIILIGLVLVIGVLVVLTLMQPSTYSVTRDMDIKAPVAVVFNQVNNLKNWKNWSPWHEKDPEMKISYAEVFEGTGGNYSWDSEEVGKGSMEIIQSAFNDSIHTEVNFGFGPPGNGRWKFTTSGGSTNASWTMSGENNFLGKFFSVFMDFDKMIGDDFDKGLNNLKTHAENGPKTTVTEKNLTASPMFSVRTSAELEELGPKMGESYGKISEHLAQQELTMAGAPLTIYHSWDEGPIDMECGIPTSAAGEGSDEVKAGNTPSGRFASTIHQGSYDNLNVTHEALKAWIEFNGYKIIGPPFEWYIVDPGEVEEKDIQTEVLYPIAAN